MKTSDIINDLRASVGTTAMEYREFNALIEKACGRLEQLESQNGKLFEQILDLANAADHVESTALFGLCRDCRHWQATTRTREGLAEYPRDKHPDAGWLDAVCKRIQLGTQITASGGWDGATVDSVETDANFGCVYFEPNASRQGRREEAI